MPDTHRIVLTADALSDLEEIAGFIRQHSPQNAASVAETILDAIDSLGSMPDRFKQAGRAANAERRFTRWWFALSWCTTEWRVPRRSCTCSTFATAAADSLAVLIRLCLKYIEAATRG